LYVQEPYGAYYSLLHVFTWWEWGTKQKMDKSIVEKERNTRNTTPLSHSKHYCIPIVDVAKSFELDDSYYPLVEMS